MRRYSLRDGMLREDTNGAWTPWAEVERVVEAAGRVAEERDLLHSTVSRVANVPVTLPNGSAAVQLAREVMDKLVPTSGRRPR